MNRQCKKIISYLSKRKKITSLTATIDLGVISLQKRLSELRNLGYQFSKKRIDKDGTHYMEYRLIGRPE